MGDQCVNIAKLIPLSGYEPPVRPEVLELILKMGAYARSEIVQCKAAFCGRDVGLAEDLARQDREINRLNREIFRHGARDRRRRRYARVGDAHDPRGTGA